MYFLFVHYQLMITLSPYIYISIYSPKCKEMCCCGKNRSNNCDHKYHCYRKCPATKSFSLKSKGGRSSGDYEMEGVRSSGRSRKGSKFSSEDDDSYFDNIDNNNNNNNNAFSPTSMIESPALINRFNNVS